MTPRDATFIDEHGRRGPLERPAASITLSGGRSALRALSRIALASLLGAELCVATGIAFGPADVGAVALLLVLPVHMVLVTCFEGLAALPRARGLIARLSAGISSSWWLSAVVAMTVIVFAEWGANRYLTDHPTGTKTVAAYGLGVVVVILSAVGVHRAADAFRSRALLRQWSWSVPALSFGALGLLAQAVAAWGVPPGYPSLEQAALGGSILCFALSAVMVVRVTGRRRALLLVLLAGASLIVLPAGVSASSEPIAERAARSRRGLGWRLVEVGRSLTDRDGDGFSSRLGGGDCADDDPSAGPLSLVGRDCLGWIPDRPALVLSSRVPSPPVGQGPSILVLVTIDAFRCGFGRFDRPELRDVCPGLSALSAQGVARFDVRTPPTTSLAMRAMHLGGELAPAVALGEIVARAGYRTHAITTHHKLLEDPRIRASFQTVDETLLSRSELPNGATAPQVTGRALVWLVEADRRSERAFLWVHYYDPHAPYVSRPGALFALDHIDAYVAEVRRTDAEIGRLAARIRSLSPASSALMVITSDHGEEFGEAGHKRHGSSLRDAAVRVPLVVWSPGSLAKVLEPERLPATPREMRPFFVQLLGGPPLRPAEEVALYAPVKGGDPQVGIVRDGWKLIYRLHLGYSELFDLHADPFERFDLSRLRPEVVRDLGRRLGTHIQQDAELRAFVAR